MSTQGLHKRPRGRAPKGKAWDANLGQWVEASEVTVTTAPTSKTTARRSRVRAAAAPTRARRAPRSKSPKPGRAKRAGAARSTEMEYGDPFGEFVAEHGMEEVVRSLRSNGNSDGDGDETGDNSGSDSDEPFHETAPYGMVVHDEATGRWHLQVRDGGKDMEDEPKLEMGFASQEAAIAAFDGVLAALNDAEDAVAGAEAGAGGGADDEEIDSDDAGWNDEDEAKYGLATASSSGVGQSTGRSDAKPSNFVILLLVILAIFVLGSRPAASLENMADALEAGMKTFPNEPPV